MNILSKLEKGGFNVINPKIFSPIHLEVCLFIRISTLTRVYFDKSNLYSMLKHTNFQQLWFSKTFSSLFQYWSLCCAMVFLNCSQQHHFNWFDLSYYLIWVSTIMLIENIFLLIREYILYCNFVILLEGSVRKTFYTYLVLGYCLSGLLSINKWLLSSSANCF